MLSSGKSQTDAPYSDHRKNLGDPVQKARCSVFGDHAIDLIGFSYSNNVTKDSEVISQIQSAFGVVSHLVARKLLSNDHSHCEMPIGCPASPCLIFSALRVTPSSTVM